VPPKKKKKKKKKIEKRKKAAFLESAEFSRKEYACILLGRDGVCGRGRGRHHLLITEVKK
jgi:hypothetical protein